MTKPRIIIDHGYYYLECDLHGITADQDSVGVKDLKAAFSIATLHYWLHHQPRERAPR